MEFISPVISSSHLYPLSEEEQPSEDEETTIYAGFGHLFENIFSCSCQFYFVSLTDPETQLIASQVLGLLGQPRKKREKEWNSFLPPDFCHEGFTFVRKSDDLTGNTGYYRCKFWRATKKRINACPAIMCLSLDYSSESFGGYPTACSNHRLQPSLQKRMSPKLPPKTISVGGR